jgi:hypothetical protein
MASRDDVEAQIRIELASVMTWCHNHPGVVSTPVLNEAVDAVLAVLDAYVGGLIASLSDTEADNGPVIQAQRRAVLAAADSTGRKGHHHGHPAGGA